MIGLLIKALVAYLLGSVSGSMVMGRIRDVDIRTSGSGNAGGTNAFRTQGFKFALAVVIIDIGKGAVAASLVPMLSFPGMGEALPREAQAMVCGFMAVVGQKAIEVSFSFYVNILPAEDWYLLLSRTHSAKAKGLVSQMQKVRFAGISKMLQNWELILNESLQVAALRVGWAWVCFSSR